MQKFYSRKGQSMNRFTDIANIQSEPTLAGHQEAKCERWSEERQPLQPFERQRSDSEAHVRGQFGLTSGLTLHNHDARLCPQMCGRFTATFEFSDIRVRWNLDRDLPKYTPRFNVAPESSPNIPVIVRHKGGNECRLMHWGLIPHWAADPSIGNRMINARAETLTELPSFKLLVDRRRCIIPADGFYEWRKEGKRKVPMWLHLRSREPFGLAGLWDVWRKPDGKRVESFTIITTEPNELVRPIHNRMPVIL